MSLAKEMWDKLSQIDVSKHTEKKGRFTYLSWAWAWEVFSENYPESQYKVSHSELPDGTMEVQCFMVVSRDGEKVKRNMWLPVLDHNNKAITKPNAFHINTSKMRCLVKCLAMYGLGHYIYAGEDLPKQKSTFEYAEQYGKSITAIKEGIAAGELAAAAEEWFTLPDEAKKGLWVTPSGNADAPFTTAERTVMKSAEFKEAHFGASEE